MTIFCPNCGSDNEGSPGARVTCRACSASFAVPGDTGSGMVPPSMGAPQPPPQQFGGQPVQHFTPQPPAVQAAQQQQAWPQQPQQAWPQQQQGWPQQAPMMAASGAPPANNTLAVVSIVSGVLCCVPFASIVAIVTGVMAKNQIKQSQGREGGDGLATAGIVLGALSLVGGCMLGILSALGNLG